MENAFRATTLISGIMTGKNAKIVPRHTFTTKTAENVFALIIYPLTLVLSVFNVLSQAIGMQTKEDAFNVQTNKFTIESEQSAHHVQSLLHCSRITNVTVVHKIHITIRPEWYVSSVHQNKYTTA